MLLALPLSDDEGLVVVVSIALWVLTWIWWYWELGTGPKLRAERTGSRVLAFVLPLDLLLLYMILRRWASSDVKDSAEYLFQYVALGAAWLGVALRFLPWLGISARDDVAERGNPAAAVALAGALLGIMLCYAGGNVGDGPGWWVVVFSSGIATAAFFLAWGVLESTAHTSDAVTIDRDVATGIRHAAFCVAQGGILARGVAGDWRSAAATAGDLAAHGWPALAVLGLAILFERALRPTGAEPRRSVFVGGVVPGAVLVAGALGWILWLGEPA
jgi:uncharacterized membrane protein YjfL (UPF0719 family)